MKKVTKPLPEDFCGVSGKNFHVEWMLSAVFDTQKVPEVADIILTLI